MCIYCFMIEEQVCRSETAAAACGESSSANRCNSSKASLAGIGVSQMLDLGSNLSLELTEKYISGSIRISSWPNSK